MVDKVQDMMNQEHRAQVHFLCKEQRGRIAHALSKLYEQVAKEHKEEAQRLYREYPNPNTPQGMMAHALAMLHEQVAKEKFLATYANFEAESKEMVKVSNRLHDNLAKTMRLMWRPLLFTWALAIVLFTAYFFVLSKQSPVRQVAAPESKIFEKSGQTSDIIAPPPVTLKSIKSVSFFEWEKVTHILEQIRKAQLKKDINLFVNAYSSTFPNIDKKKENILKTWQQYDYLDMHFHVENIQKPTNYTIIVRVAWNITLEDIHSKKKSNLLKDYTINFSNLSGNWLIQELIQEEKTSQVATKSSL